LFSSEGRDRTQGAVPPGVRSQSCLVGILCWAQAAVPDSSKLPEESGDMA
jgi:hypothetical protein